MRYCDVVGYGIPTNRGNGVWSDSITERTYYGDVLNVTRYLEESDKVNDDIRLSQRISIVADAFAYENFSHIKYASWMGSLWTVSSVEIQRPRLLFLWEESIMADARRNELNDILMSILGSDNVYFQPPEERLLKYPCIVYGRDRKATMRADNIPYRSVQGYEVTYISYDPDSDVLDKLEGLPYSEYRRHFATSGLNHDVFVIYH